MKSVHPGLKLLVLKTEKGEVTSKTVNADSRSLSSTRTECTLGPPAQTDTTVAGDNQTVEGSAPM